MAIKFIPADRDVNLLGREEHDKQLLSLLRCIFNKLNRVELQLEKLTDEPIDQDDGDIL